MVAIALTAFLIPATTSHADDVGVAARDNFFEPREIFIQPGDTVTWTASGFRRHSVNSDDDLFASGDMDPGESFSRTFNKEGTFAYFCRFHGKRGGVGMSGTVVVGTPDEPEPDPSQRLVVPRDYKTIQGAVDHARPGTIILVRPGTYREEVLVTTRRITIKGVDRFRTVLNGGDRLANGISFTATGSSRVKNLTVRNYTGAGISFEDVTDYVVSGVDAIKNRTYGISALRSYGGTITKSFAWGSGDSALSMRECFGCSTLVENVVAAHSFMGVSAMNTTGLVVRDSRFTRNGAGIVASSWSSLDHMPGRGLFIEQNMVVDNNNTTVPPAGVATTHGLPFGTGIWLAGVEDSEVRGNSVRNHDHYGVLVSNSFEDIAPLSNAVLANTVAESDAYELAWDGAGGDNCFDSNIQNGPTGPPDIEIVYACANRPFEGTVFDPVADHLETAFVPAPRATMDPPEPRRPSCQRGAPECKR
ncbi:MAG: right-handed parallel beta-helix repeat-containing protein [Actinomycetota bacterium]